MYDATARWADHEGNSPTARQYADLAGWVRKRSPENYIWIIALESVIGQAIQHTIVRYLKPEDDIEFEEVEIIIDKSFVRRPEHLIFWKEWLRNGLTQKSMKQPLVTPDTWSNRNHPFNRKYYRGGNVLEMSELFRDHMYFQDSKVSEGLQLADTCANVCFRRYFKNRRFKPFDLLALRIVGEHGRKMTLIVLNEASVRKDAPEAHVKPLNLDLLIRDGRSLASPK